MKLSKTSRFGFATILLVTVAAACSQPAPAKLEVSEQEKIWPKLSPPALDPQIESRIDEIMSKMTLEQKVGQVIQADSDSVTPEEVRRYRLGSVLSGGNSAPGEEPYAAAEDWLAAADAYFEASKDTEGVEIAIPVIWGIDAVHGHANLSGATVFPHNIGLGAANDPDLIEEITEVTAAELIVSGHDWTFAPTLAVPRDDRWGRTYEGFSEDPAIVASYGNRIVYGLQGRPGTESFFDASSVISSAKHFVGDGGTTNGVDQGDTAISEEELQEIHAAGYVTAIEADVQTIMASFNSWNGVKMHGHKRMLTDVLKDRMGFNGFVIGDWNGHGHVPGCTNTDCPAALTAGVDMYMAPDSWKGIYNSTLEAAQSGEITEARLNDAVRRILRVKLQAGLFEKSKPSARPGAGDISSLGSVAHREVARRSVRQSLVLLKNNGGLLPLDASKTVLVVGDGADSISKQAGGWTLSWQGRGYENSDFPNGQSILAGIRDAVSANGGEVIFDPAGTSEVDADVVIAVYGEEPYAEFQGDLDNLDFQPNGFDLDLLGKYQAGGTPVVSVFLSGRPLWVNPEINNSDAFVAAWLPGTEGGGVADLLFQSDPSFDFTGRLSYSWPASAVDFDNNSEAEAYAPLFALGYGLSFGDSGDDLGTLSEDSGIEAEASASSGFVFRQGGTVKPWKAFLVSEEEGVLFNGTGANVSGLSAKRTDHLAQEDAFSLTFSDNGRGLIFIPENQAVDWSEELTDGKSLGFAFKSELDSALSVQMGCRGQLDCDTRYEVSLAPGDWREVKVPLQCLAGAGDMSEINTGLLFSSGAGASFALADIRLVNSAAEQAACQN